MTAKTTTSANDLFSQEMRLIHELRESQKETDRQLQELGKKIQATTENVNGIAKSNGMFAEDYFYNALETKQIFAGIHFDKVLRNQHAIRRLPDGNRLESEFDLQLTNRKAVALISLKYRVRKSNVKDMVERQVVNFRQLFPEYDGYKIYLGIGGMSFDKGVIDEAKKLGIGLLQQKGEIVEYVNDEVKPY
ncbi:MAG: hypothetical protein LBP75_09765 [Planctomycetota bacterium]|jgi:hypothetical protein|nr:hypothetical protein [Planctomycetota bacterium]